MKRFLAGLGVAIVLLPALPASADEAWLLPNGEEVTWDQDIDGISVLSYPVGRSRERVHLYVRGLADAVDSRGTFYAYWIGPSSDSYCDASLTGPDGTTSDSFGQAIITFDQPTFPSGWSALLGQCFDAPSDEVRANALYGDQVVVPRN
ncbi:hypothetical protein [Hoeflea sp.]|uniref:hypothetical protein n=1 Tax=Hoeflea sp. TaxID=1940281 RepID=UPI0019BCEF99|nr:hypothetical protein [Hoeflea sp.]MBC7282291.1 hypothetical protein [Hoeflea sp.]